MKHEKKELSQLDLDVLSTLHLEGFSNREISRFTKLDISESLLSRIMNTQVKDYIPPNYQPIKLQNG